MLRAAFGRVGFRLGFWAVLCFLKNGGLRP